MQKENNDEKSRGKTNDKFHEKKITKDKVNSVNNQIRIYKSTDKSSSNLNRSSSKLNDIPNSKKNIVENTQTKYANKKLQEMDLNFSKKSNKAKIKNAISTVCLAGNSNTNTRKRIIDQIDNSSCDNYIILFKDNIGRKDLRAVYTFDSEDQKVELLCCVVQSPLFLQAESVVGFYKYDNSKKEFSILSENKKFYYMVDAVSLKKI